jgi:hypothetical protein
LGRDSTRGLWPHGPVAYAADGASRPSKPAWSAWPSVQVGRPAHDVGAWRAHARHTVTVATPSLVVWMSAAHRMSRRGAVHRGGPVGSGSLTGKVGHGGTHLGSAAPVRAKRTMHGGVRRMRGHSGWLPWLWRFLQDQRGKGRVRCGSIGA